MTEYNITNYGQCDGNFYIMEHYTMYIMFEAEIRVTLPSACQVVALLAELALVVEVALLAEVILVGAPLLGDVKISCE